MPSETPQLSVENSAILKEVVVVKSIESNYTDSSLYEEGIVAKTDLNGIVDFEEVVISATSTDIILATSTEAITVKTIESFAFVPAVFNPKDPASVDLSGDQYALGLTIVLINATTSTDVSASATTTQNNIERIGNDIAENNQNTTSSLEIIPVTSVNGTATTTLHLVINAISIGTASSTLDEFIEIYNPTSEIVSLDGWKLQRVTASGKTANYLVRPFPSDSSINSNQHFLIIHPSVYTTTTPEKIVPNLAYTTVSSIAASNTIILFNSQGEVVDFVGYGEATQFEEASALELSNDGQVLIRTDGKDTDRNDVDFKLTSR